MIEALIPCRFCDSTNVKVDCGFSLSDGISGWSKVVCLYCAATGPKHVVHGSRAKYDLIRSDLEGRAIESWNKRAGQSVSGGGGSDAGGASSPTSATSVSVEEWTELDVRIAAGRGWLKDKGDTGIMLAHNASLASLTDEIERWKQRAEDVEAAYRDSRDELRG